MVLALHSSEQVSTGGERFVLEFLGDACRFLEVAVSCRDSETYVFLPLVFF